jgi:hypothetical protein
MAHSPTTIRLLTAFYPTAIRHRTDRCLTLLQPSLTLLQSPGSSLQFIQLQFITWQADNSSSYNHRSLSYNHPAPRCNLSNCNSSHGRPMPTLLQQSLTLLQPSSSSLHFIQLKFITGQADASPSYNHRSLSLSPTTIRLLNVIYPTVIPQMLHNFSRLCSVMTRKVPALRPFALGHL